MEDHALDFSDVDSLERAESLYHAGKLERLYLMPLRFGGVDIPPNIVYVPPGIAGIKQQLDNTIEQMVQEGTISRYAAEPEYKGKSFVPSRIKVTASHPEKPGAFTPTINIW